MQRVTPASSLRNVSTAAVDAHTGLPLPESTFTLHTLDLGGVAVAAHQPQVQLHVSTKQTVVFQRRRLSLVMRDTCFDASAVASVAYCSAGGLRLLDPAQPLPLLALPLHVPLAATGRLGLQISLLCTARGLCGREHDLHRRLLRAEADDACGRSTGAAAPLRRAALAAAPRRRRRLGGRPATRSAAASLGLAFALLALWCAPCPEHVMQ